MKKHTPKPKGIITDWSGCEDTEGTKVFFEQPEVKKYIAELAEDIKENIDRDIMRQVIRGANRY